MDLARPYRPLRDGRAVFAGHGENRNEIKSASRLEAAARVSVTVSASRAKCKRTRPFSGWSVNP